MAYSQKQSDFLEEWIKKTGNFETKQEILNMASRHGVSQNEVREFLMSLVNVVGDDETKLLPFIKPTAKKTLEEINKLHQVLQEVGEEGNVEE